MVLTLQFHGVQVSLLSHEGKYLFLNGRWSQLHTQTENKCQQISAVVELFFFSSPHLYSAKHAGIEDVHAGVDLIGHEDLRLLHEAVYSARVGLEHHHAVLGRLLHSCHLQAQSDFSAQHPS